MGVPFCLLDGLVTQQFFQFIMRDLAGLDQADLVFLAIPAFV